MKAPQRLNASESKQIYIVYKTTGQFYWAFYQKMIIWHVLIVLLSDVFAKLNINADIELFKETTVITPL